MIIVRTPIRISFVGGGTDFRDYWSKNRGGVISTSIDKYVFAIDFLNNAPSINIILKGKE